jgi:hypothetical protein
VAVVTEAEVRELLNVCGEYDGTEYGEPAVVFWAEAPDCRWLPNLACDEAPAAAKIASLLLGDRRPKNPAAYCRKAIQSDPDPVARFAIPPLAWPPWCGECDERDRTRETEPRPGAVVTVERCPNCHPLRDADPNPPRGATA